MPLNYRIDADDRITSWCPEYAAFALANDGPELADAQMTGRELWDFIRDTRTSAVYRSLIERARDGVPSTFCFRCDGPNLRRDLSMTIEPIADGGVSFTIDTVSTEDRRYQPILDRRGPRGGDHVLFCSWCNRLRAGVGWHEVETAVPMLGIFDDADLPRLEYVMCDTCYTARTGA